jgi:hypothetical protein
MPPGGNPRAADCVGRAGCRAPLGCAAARVRARAAPAAPPAAPGGGAARRAPPPPPPPRRPRAPWAPRARKWAPRRAPPPPWTRCAPHPRRPAPPPVDPVPMAARCLTARARAGAGPSGPRPCCFSSAAFLCGALQSFRAAAPPRPRRARQAAGRGQREGGLMRAWRRLARARGARGRLGAPRAGARRRAAGNNKRGQGMFKRGASYPGRGPVEEARGAPAARS